MRRKAVTDFRIGHGLGPRAFGGSGQLFPMTKLPLRETAQRHNFTIFLETSDNANVYSRLLSVQ